MSTSLPPVAESPHIKEVVRRLGAVLRTARVHYADNPALIEAGELLRRQLHVLVDAYGPLHLQVRLGELFINGDRMAADLGATRSAAGLPELLEQAGVTGMRIERPPRGDELRAFLGVWRSNDPRPGVDPGAAMNSMLDAVGVTAVRLDAREEPRRPEEPDVTREALRTYAELVAVADFLTDPIASGDPETARKAEAAVRRAASLAATMPRLVLPLTAHSDPGRYEAVHAANTALLGMLMGLRLGLGAEAVADIGRGGLHADLGLALLANDARDHVGTLDPETVNRVLSHPIESFLLALDGTGLSVEARARAVVAYEHHCGVDGQGYPGPAPGGLPHLYARIVAIADAYDALVHDRGDRDGVSRPLALEAVAQDAGTRLDPGLLKVLYGLLGRFPPGSALRLEDGSVALSVLPSEDPRFFDRPRVVVVRDRTGLPLPVPRHLDLADDSGDAPPRVAAVLPDRLVPDRLLPLLYA